MYYSFTYSVNYSMFFCQQSCIFTKMNIDYQFKIKRGLVGAIIFVILTRIDFLLLGMTF